MNAPLTMPPKVETPAPETVADTHGAAEAEGQTRLPLPELLVPAQPKPEDSKPAPAAKPTIAEKRPSVSRKIAAGLFSLAIGTTKALATLAIALVAIVSALVTWDYYVTAPWTRDGHVRVQVASVAPQVSGQILELKVTDNQYVHRGDVLYVIDKFDFQTALRGYQAEVAQRTADLEVKQAQSKRRQNLSELATTPEEKQVFAGNAAQAKAALDVAQQRVAQAAIDLKRTEVTSPVNGYVTNLQLRVGDYARAGATTLSVIDTDSYWVDGNFEETKLARICIGDQVEAKLMGYAQPILGHVTTVTRGIGVSDAASGTQGLPNVNPVYTWVRLAQRVPVRIAIDHVPDGVPLVSGTTATITIKDTTKPDSRPWLNRTIAAVETRLSDVLAGPPARPECIPATTPEGVTASTALNN